MKYCKKGHERTPENTGWGGRCKACRRKWQKANPEKVSASVRKWRKANPEKVSASRRKWQKANPEKVSASTRKWEKANPEKVSASTRKWKKANPEKKSASERKNYFRRLARKKGKICKDKSLPFDLTESFLCELATRQDYKCAVTGVEMVIGIGKGRSHYNMSLDRVIPEKGYVKDNVRFVCHIINTMKQDLSDDELLTWGKLLVAGLQAKHILVTNSSPVADIF